jgi:N-acetylmuramoyl-L-alanine amidase
MYGMIPRRACRTFDTANSHRYRSNQMPTRTCVQPRSDLRITLLLFLLLLVNTSCGPPPQSLPHAEVRRAIWLQPANWAHANADSARDRIDRFVASARDLDPKVLLVQLDGAAKAAAPDFFDPLAVAITAGHRHGLLVHPGISLTIAPEEPPAAARVRWKQIARHLATHYDIDGLYISRAASFDSPGSAALGVAAEALLVKPYLVVSSRDLDLAAVLPAVPHLLTTDEVAPVSWRADPSQVVALDLSDWLPDAADHQVHVDSAAHEPRTDSAGRLAMFFSQRPDTLLLAIDGDSLALETRFWKPPYRYAVTADGSVTRTAPWVELRAAPESATTRDAFEFLGRTDSTAQATINGVDVKVYATGVFFDTVALAEGANRVRLEARWPDGGGVAVYQQQFDRHSKPLRAALPLWLDEKSVTPTDTLALQPADVVRLSFRGSRGQQATAHIRPGGLEIPFERLDGDQHAKYRADLQLSRLRPGRRYEVEIRLQETNGNSQIKHRLAAPIEVREAHDFPLVITSAAESYVSFSLGSVRLGGPYIAEYPEGVVLQTSGRFGRRHRLRLGPQGEGYINRRYVDEAPAGTVIPRYHITNTSARATDSTDVIRFPRPEPVPYVVHSDPDGRRILVTLHGVQTSSTWLAHRSGLRVVDKITWRQVDAETYEAAIHLTTDRIWGYDVAPEGGSLVVTIRHPPELSDDTEQPLQGLKIAIEAGHGGSNTGAIGLSGMLERDVNLATALALGDLCRNAGARVVQLRDGVDGVPYMARRDSVRDSGAHLFISIHANAAGGGFLRAGGTSMFYHDPFWAPLASSIYGQMLDLGFGEFGTVGSFNYRPTRMSSMPAVLVEQAFMTHAEDEEFLASAAGRQAIAEKVLAGLLQWLKDQPVDRSGALIGIER